VSREPLIVRDDDVTLIKPARDVGYLRNCLIKPRAGESEEWLFLASDRAGVQCRLDGYAIVPRAEYEMLLGLVAPRDHGEA
jgi:hypothetical protein